MLALVLKVGGVGELARLLYVGDGGLLARMRHLQGVGMLAWALDVDDTGTAVVDLLLLLHVALGAAVSHGRVEGIPPVPPPPRPYAFFVDCPRLYFFL